jgi:hypothetical protein
MNYDSIATICVGGINIEQCPEVRYQLLISTDDHYFKERFHSWQLEQKFVDVSQQLQHKQ